MTTVYIGAYFKWTGSTTTMKSYYYAGGTRVAMRTGTNTGTVNYLLGDHLGSQALTLTSAGARLNTNTELRYMPYGAARYTAGMMPTSFNFTGQRKNSGSGLLFYNARWYDPVVGRFLSSDTVVQAGSKSSETVLPLTVSYANPWMLQQWNELQRSGRQANAPIDPQLLNRYAYARNNPLVYTDNSGNVIWWVAGAIGGVLGGAAGFGAYALTHQENFDWGQAALWTGGGALIGATFGVATNAVVAAIGAEAAVAAGTTGATLGAAANSQTGQRTILWLGESTSASRAHHGSEARLGQVGESQW